RSRTYRTLAELRLGSRLLHQAPAHGPDQLALRHRFAEQVALPDMAADGLQLVALVRRLDAFGHGLEPEPLAELDDGLAQAGIDPVDVAVADVAAVDLELAERQLPQPRQ